MGEERAGGVSTERDRADEEEGAADTRPRRGSRWWMSRSEEPSGRKESASKQSQGVHFKRASRKCCAE